MRNTPGAPVWQRNDYEHIIRQGESLERIRRYILENPPRWAFDRENPTNAFEILKTAAPSGLGGNGSLYPFFLRGQAYVLLRRGSEAAAEFQRLLDHRGIIGNAPVGALAHLGLARAYALAGDAAKARTAYQDFFALWKDAGPGVPLLKQARAEYAQLK